MLFVSIVFALVERKNDTPIIEKYRPARSPEIVEGQAKTWRYDAE